MFAIQNIETGKFVYGTDYRYNPPHQRTSHNKALTYATRDYAKLDFMRRHCGKQYRVVCLKTIEVKQVIDFDSDGGYTLKGEIRK